MREPISRVMIYSAFLASTCCRMVNRATPDLLALMDVGRIQRAESEFRSSGGRYGSLQELGPAGAGLISAELASGEHVSYRIDLSITEHGYVLRVRPVHWGSNTRRSYYSDETQIVHESWTENEATAQSPRLPMAQTP